MCTRVYVYLAPIASLRVSACELSVLFDLSSPLFVAVFRKKMSVRRHCAVIVRSLCGHCAVIVRLRNQGNISRKKHLSKEAIRKIAHKQILWEVYKRTGNVKDYTNYKEAFNLATTEIRKSKRTFSM